MMVRSNFEKTVALLCNVATRRGHSTTNIIGSSGIHEMAARRILKELEAKKLIKKNDDDKRFYITIEGVEVIKEAKRLIQILGGVLE